MTDVDVAIIGGGPAGSSMGAYLAKAGVSCTIFEREQFPRPHVGESMVPSSTRVFQDLGFLPKMEAAGFIHKYGAAWTSEVSARQWRVNWEGLRAESYVEARLGDRPQAGVDQLYTYHVDRGKFDHLLLEHAEELGARVHQNSNVTAVDFSEPDAVRLHHRVGAREDDTTCRMVVDASGRRAVLGNQKGWRITDPVFDQYALHSWFEGYDRAAWNGDHDTRDYIFIHFLPLTNTWMWQIPITGSVTSIGVVTQRRNFQARRGSREAFFWSAIATRPDVHDALRAATQLRPLKTEADYSYAMEQITDDRVVLVGDAARFVDPIFSTGVSIALNSSRFAVGDIVDGLSSGHLSRAAFGNYEATMQRGMRNWYEFIRVYYRLNVLFTAFVSDERHRYDMLKLLQGDVYDEEPAVLGRMRDIVGQVEGDPDHVWHHLLGDLTANAFVDAAG